MRRTSIRFRLILMMICLTTLPVITVTWVATNNTRNSVEKEIVNANNSRMMWVDQYLKELIQQIDTLFYTLQINQKLMDGLSDIDNPDVGVQFSTQNYIRDTLTSAFYTNSRKVDGLTLYIHSNKKAFTVNFVSSGMISYLDIENGPWSRMLRTPINIFFKQSGRNIYAFHSINRFPDKKLLGGLSVCINKKVWEEVSSILKSEPESSVFLINDEGEMLAGSTVTEIPDEIQTLIRSLNLQQSSLEFLKTEDYFYFIKRIHDGQLTIVKAVPLKTVNSSASATITAGIFMGSLFALISILLSILLSLRISRPIVSLARTMKKTRIENFEMIAVQSRDEMGLLERGYNFMMQRIKELIEDRYHREIEVKNAQLAALQAQINPHFLNNTLSLIGGMALKKSAPEIYKVTQVVGDLLRYSISTGDDMVLLKDELNHMRNYLFIQEHRFAGRCTVDVSADETIYDSILPRFTLQPIVENAFEHGLQGKEGAWNVKIRIKRIGNRIAIMVKDNGVGLDRERLSEVRAGLQESLWNKADRVIIDVPRRKRGIGLRNVNTRLKLQFGKGYGVRIFSRQGAGTVVVLGLPVPKRGE